MIALKWAFDIHTKTGTEAYTRYELDIDGFYKDIWGNTTFDKTWLENFAEKPITRVELKVKQILPLVAIDGLLYMTNKWVYF